MFLVYYRAFEEEEEQEEKNETVCRKSVVNCC